MNLELLLKHDYSIDERLSHLSELFRSLYGEPNRTMRVVYAPGRAEIIGNHTDYNQGYTLSANVSANLLLVATERPDKKVRIFSDNIDGPVVEFDASSSEALLQQRIQPGDADFWSDYVKGVLWAYLKDGHDLRGFDAVIGSTIPTGAGLSSSAALETAVSRLVCAANDISVSPAEQVTLCKRAENEYVGIPCGYLDQATVGLSDQWLLMSYRPEDGQPFTHQSVEVALASHQKILIVGYDPLSKHALVDGKYAVRQQACLKSLPVLSELLDRNISALRDVSSVEFESVRQAYMDATSEQEADFVTHVVYENERVLSAQTMLETADFEGFGELMTESGHSAIYLYDLAEDAPELRYVYDTVAKDMPALGVLGIRNMGGGFCSTTLALVEESAHDNYVAELGRMYRKKFNREYKFLSFVPAPAAGVIGDA